MSRHLFYHLVVPLIVGLSVETLIAWAPWHEHSSFSFLKYWGTWERGGFYISLLLTYLCIAGWLVNQEAKPPWRRVFPRMLDDALEDATSFIATCTIPLKGWFDPYTQLYFSHIVKHQLRGGTLRHERVLLFFRDSDLKHAKTQYLDGLYAQPLAMIHENYGIRLGYLEPADIKAILHDNSGCELDFAFITHQRSPETVLLFKKKGHLLTLREIHKEHEVAPYRDMVNAIRMKVSGSETPIDKLQPNRPHDFCDAVLPG